MPRAARPARAGSCRPSGRAAGACRRVLEGVGGELQRRRVRRHKRPGALLDRRLTSSSAPAAPPPAQGARTPARWPRGPGRARAGSRRSPPPAPAARSSGGGASRRRCRARRPTARPTCGGRTRRRRGRRWASRRALDLSGARRQRAPSQRPPRPSPGRCPPAAARARAVRGHDADERLHQRVHRVQRGAAVHAAMEVVPRSGR